jgi:RecB family exonuclease
VTQTQTVPANTVASFSDLGTFNQCRRRWWLATYRRLRRIDEPPTGPLPFGSRIHAALEAFYDGTVADPATAWNALMQHEFAVDSSQRRLAHPDLDKESKLGHRMLEGYLEWLAETGEDAYWDDHRRRDQAVPLPDRHWLTRRTGTRR